MLNAADFCHPSASAGILTAVSVPTLSLRHVADLIDRCYEREPLLHANHVHSFAPALRFTESLARSRQELEEYRKHRNRVMKLYVWPDESFSSELAQAQKRARKQCVASGNIWDEEVTAFDRRFTQLRFQSPSEFRRLQERYSSEQAELFQEEVERFSTPLSRSEDHLNERNAVFYTAVFQSEHLRSGLSLDQKLSTRVSPVFSKTIARDWKIAVHVDGKKLNAPHLHPVKNLTTGETLYPGPSVEMHVSIRPLAPSKEQVGKYAQLRFDWIFPTYELGLAHSYEYFRSRRELEAILHIYIEMFCLIEQELGAALLKESAEAGL